MKSGALRRAFSAARRNDAGGAALRRGSGLVPPACVLQHRPCRAVPFLSNRCLLASSRVAPPHLEVILSSVDARSAVASGALAPVLGEKRSRPARREDSKRVAWAAWRPLSLQPLTQRAVSRSQYRVHESVIPGPRDGRRCGARAHGEMKTHSWVCPRRLRLGPRVVRAPPRALSRSRVQEGVKGLHASCLRRIRRLRKARERGIGHDRQSPQERRQDAQPQPRRLRPRALWSRESP